MFIILKMQSLLDSDDSYMYMEGGNRRKSKKGDKKENCCFKMMKRVFTTMYPSHPAHPYTTQGIWLKNLMTWFCFGHIIFFIVGLGLAGFISMITNLILAALCYSVKLTLHKCIAIFYMFSLLVSAGYALSVTLMDREGATSYMQMGVVAEIVFYGCVMYFGGRAILSFI